LRRQMRRSMVEAAALLGRQTSPSPSRESGSLQATIPEIEVKIVHNSACELTSHRIQWNFITERAPWMGGYWERLIRSIKTSLKKDLQNAMLDEEETRENTDNDVVKSRDLEEGGAFRMFQKYLECEKETEENEVETEMEKINHHVQDQREKIDGDIVKPRDLKEGGAFIRMFHKYLECEKENEVETEMEKIHCHNSLIVCEVGADLSAITGIK
ncbi:hypothetical protein T10_13537, partial [Trichinella papuae]